MKVKVKITRTETYVHTMDFDVDIDAGSEIFDNFKVSGPWPDRKSGG